MVDSGYPHWKLTLVLMFGFPILMAVLVGIVIVDKWKAWK